MNSHGYFDVSNDSFKITGSQINLTPRSGKANLQYSEKICRPCSCKIVVKEKVKLTRPRSAGFNSLNPTGNNFLQSPISLSKNDVSGESSLALSNFTNLSSKVLQNLLGSFNYQKEFESKRNFSKSLSQLSSDDQLKSQTNKASQEIGEKNQVLCMHCLSTDLKLQKTNESGQKNTYILDPIDDIKFLEEKSVRFLDKKSPNFSEEKLCLKKYEEMNNQAECYGCLENKCKSYCHKNQLCQRYKKVDRARVLELEHTETDLKHTEHTENESDSVSFSSCIENKIFESKQEYENKVCELEENSSEKNNDENFSQARKNENLQLLYSLEKDVQRKIKDNKQSESLIFSSKEEINKELLKDNDEVKKSREVDSVHQELEMTDPTYEEIILLLQTLDEEDNESINLETREDATETPLEIKVSPKERTDYQFPISSYLQKLEAEVNSLHDNYFNKEKWNSTNADSPRLEELLNKNSVELAHEVFSLKIQMEDQKRGIKLLKDTLSEMKEAKKKSELEHQEALNKVTSEAEALVQRHQKFIKQLLNEKKNLNQTVSKLVQDLKSEEERYKRNIRAIEEKHLIEVKRAKEVQAAADKIKREKWMENKTQKIKEMTVKSLEPELSRMASRQQEEMVELRNLHKAELEAIELRAARRNAELMDELRAELTKEKERAINKETANLRSELEKEFQNEKNNLQQHIQTLKDRIRREEEKLSNQELVFQQRLIDCKQEEEIKRQKIIRDHQENLEELRRQHLIELRNLKESEKVEKEVALNNLKKEEAAKFFEKETELHQQYKRERDREIELVIETLEKESAQIQSELNAASEGKLKRLREKMGAEIKEIEANESILKQKLSEIRSKLTEKEDSITELKSQIRQLQTEMAVFQKSCEEMSLEKAKVREIIRGEFETTINDLIKEKKNLEKEIGALKESHTKELTKKDQLNIQTKYEMQKELTRVYSRIKAAVNKKDKIIQSLREENEAVNQKCRELEFMLDQQRRNLLL